MHTDNSSGNQLCKHKYRTNLNFILVTSVSEFLPHCTIHTQTCKSHRFISVTWGEVEYRFKIIFLRPCYTSDMQQREELPFIRVNRLVRLLSPEICEVE